MSVVWKGFGLLEMYLCNIMVIRVVKFSSGGYKSRKILAFHHTAHILHGKLNYFLTYDTSLIRDQRHALMIRDETINVLRMAVDSNQD